MKALISFGYYGKNRDAQVKMSFICDFTASWVVKPSGRSEEVAPAYCPERCSTKLYCIRQHTSAHASIRHILGQKKISNELLKSQTRHVT
jgi:hypothetical protein